MNSNLITSAMMPVEGMGQMSEMYKDGKTYEVMVDDKRNPGSPIFAFGLNGKIGEYPTNSKIRLLGEEIRHLYNCIYEEPVTEQVGQEKFLKLVGQRQVCRFSITPTSWDALPGNAVLLNTLGTVRVDSTKVNKYDEQLAEMQKEADMGSDISVDDMMAARENELKEFSYNDLKELANDRGLKSSGVSKAKIVESLLKFEEEVLKGD